MVYKVLQYFEDLQDNGHAYRAGEKYPRPGYRPAPERLAELSGMDNRRGEALIAEDGEAGSIERKAANRKRKAE